MTKFDMQDTFTIKGRGVVVIGLNPFEEVNNQRDYIGRKILITCSRQPDFQPVERTIRGFERFAVLNGEHGYPGETVSFLVDEF